MQEFGPSAARSTGCELSGKLLHHVRSPETCTHAHTHSVTHAMLPLEFHARDCAINLYFSHTHRVESQEGASGFGYFLFVLALADWPPLPERLASLLITLAGWHDAAGRV